MNDAGRIGFVIRGVYNAVDTYDFLDVVYYNGASYVAKKLTVGNEPEENNDYWQILVKRADAGDYITHTDYATAEIAGIVKVDGTTIMVTEDGKISGSNQIVVDAELNSDSENPVQNKVVESALQEKANKSELDKEVEGSYAAGVAEELSLINTDLVQRTNTKEASSEKSLANLKETGIYAVRDADDMPNGKTSAILEVNNFAPQNGNYCIQRVVYIEDYKKIYQRRLHQEEGASSWEEFVSISFLSDVLPYIFKYFTTQPFFVISENTEDTMYCKNRGCVRNSSAKALIFKIGGRLKDVSVKSGYGIISYTNSDISCTALTDYGGLSTVQKHTPRGNIVSIGIMGAAWVSTGGTESFPVIATISGKTYELSNSMLYTDDPESYLFILSIADFYLF